LNLDFKEIENGDKFEDLVVSYFEDIKNETNNISNVEIKPSGTGTDGGRDILVSFNVTDGILDFKRTWVIQCKFHNKNISTSNINDINIPSLIHSYNASGYLLIVKEKPTSKLTDLFERLEGNCKLDYKYMIWSGEQFKRLIITKSIPGILQQYFPNYYSYCVQNEIL